MGVAGDMSNDASISDNAMQYLSFPCPRLCTDALDRTQTSAVYSVPRSCEAHNACRYPSVTPISLCRLVATATSRDK
jgi:hypothetical protein